MPQPQVPRIVQEQFAERLFVAREMQHLARHCGPLAEPELRQVVAQEFDPAADMRAGELGPIALGGIAAAAQIPNVVEQGHDHTGEGALRAQLPQRLDLLLVAGADAGHGQRHIERVLAIVIERVDARVARRAAREHVVELGDRAAQGVGRCSWPGAGKQLLDGLQDSGRRAHPHRVGDVKIAAPDIDHAGMLSCRGPLLCCAARHGTVSLGQAASRCQRPAAQFLPGPGAPTPPRRAFT